MLNTMKDGEWGDEEKYDLLEAFYPGRQFHIQFNVRDDDYEVCLLGHSQLFWNTVSEMNCWYWSSQGYDV